MNGLSLRQAQLLGRLGYISDLGVTSRLARRPSTLFDVLQTCLRNITICSIKFWYQIFTRFIICNLRLIMSFVSQSDSCLLGTLAMTSRDHSICCLASCKLCSLELLYLSQRSAWCSNSDLSWDGGSTQLNVVNFLWVLLPQKIDLVKYWLDLYHSDQFYKTCFGLSIDQNSSFDVMEIFHI